MRTLAEMTITDDLFTDRTGKFEHPVLITLEGARGRAVEMKSCVICAEEGGYLSKRQAVALPGEVCPVCNADLCPVRAA